MLMEIGARGVLILSAEALNLLFGIYPQSFSGRPEIAFWLGAFQVPYLSSCNFQRACYWPENFVPPWPFHFSLIYDYYKSLRRRSKFCCIVAPLGFDARPDPKAGWRSTRGQCKGPVRFNTAAYLEQPCFYKKC